MDTTLEDGIYQTPGMASGAAKMATTKQQPSVGIPAKFSIPPHILRAMQAQRQFQKSPEPSSTESYVVPISVALHRGDRDQDRSLVFPAAS